MTGSKDKLYGNKQSEQCHYLQTLKEKIHIGIMSDAASAGRRIVLNTDFFQSFSQGHETACSVSPLLFACFYKILHIQDRINYFFVSAFF